MIDQEALDSVQHESEAAEREREDLRLDDMRQTEEDELPQKEDDVWDRFEAEREWEIKVMAEAMRQNNIARDIKQALERSCDMAVIKQLKELL